MAATTNLAFIQNMVGGSLLSISYTASNLMLVTLRYVAIVWVVCVLRDQISMISVSKK